LRDKRRHWQPTTGDAIAAGRYIQTPDVHEGCCQNQSGSYCTTMMCEGTACVGICSADGPFALYCDTCLDAGNGLLDIANSCSSNGLSGGWDGQTRLMASVSSFSTLKGYLEAVNDFSTRFVSITYVLLSTDPYERFTGLDPCLTIIPS
jgi:hypothetical protein